MTGRLIALPLACKLFEWTRHCCPVGLRIVETGEDGMLAVCDVLCTTCTDTTHVSDYCAAHNGYWWRQRLRQRTERWRHRVGGRPARRGGDKARQRNTAASRRPTTDHRAAHRLPQRPRALPSVVSRLRWGPSGSRSGPMFQHSTYTVAASSSTDRRRRRSPCPWPLYRTGLSYIASTNNSKLFT